MLLSILMIVKNEEKFLEQCCEALKPVLQAFPSELIISDTGSTDNTPAIAQKYATKYLEIEWHDDFALARNQGLRHARGKWVCFIDADEILQNPQAIIDFFRSGEYKKYKSADWLIQNIIGGLSHGSSRMQRLVRRIDKTKFVGAIHEQLNPINLPRKNLDAKFKHYGYEGEVVEKKDMANRNRDSVVRNYEKNPDNINYHLHYIDQLNVDRNREKAIELCFLGLEKYKDNPLYPPVFLDRLSKYLEASRRNEENIEILEKYFSENKIRYTIEPQVMLRLAIACEITKSYQKAVEYYQQVFDVYEKEIAKPSLNKYAEYLGVTIQVKQDDLEVLKPILAKLYSVTGNFEKAQHFCNELNISVNSMYAIFAQENPDKLQDIMNHAQSTGDINNILVATKFVKLGMDKLRFIKMRKDYKEQKDISKQLSQFLNEKTLYTSDDAELLAYAMAYGIYIDESKLDFTTNDIDKMIRLMIENIDDIEVIVLDYAEKTNFLLNSKCIVLTLLISELAYALITKLSQKHPMSTDLFNTYVLVKNEYLKNIYKLDVYTEQYIENLIPEDIFVFFISKAYDHSGRDLIKYFEKAMIFYTFFNNITNPLIEIFYEQIGIHTHTKEEIEDNQEKQATIILDRLCNLENINNLFVGIETEKIYTIIKIMLEKEPFLPTIITKYLRVYNLTELKHISIFIIIFEHMIIKTKNLKNIKEELFNIWTMLKNRYNHLCYKNYAHDIEIFPKKDKLVFYMQQAYNSTAEESILYLKEAAKYDPYLAKNILKNMEKYYAQN